MWKTILRALRSTPWPIALVATITCISPFVKDSNNLAFFRGGSLPWYIAVFN
ncbi:hypothetical protein LAUMK15_05734 [Mycobacterium persicum]|nr:hypothetical protein LAUMK15_05734 [Mycobacterium persicum]